MENTEQPYKTTAYMYSALYQAHGTDTKTTEIRPWSDLPASSTHHVDLCTTNQPHYRTPGSQKQDAAGSIITHGAHS